MGYPTELRERAATTESAAETRELNDAASDWALTQYHCSIVEGAIANYSEYEQANRGTHA